MATTIDRTVASRAGAGWRDARAWARALGLAAAFVGLVVAAGIVARQVAAERLGQEAQARLPPAVAALRGELEKQRALPAILREDPGVQAALAGRDPAALRAVDEKLERLAQATRAAVIYVLDASGLAVAASNFRAPTSFVGSDYRFRDYYRGAMDRGSAEQFALGTVSGRPGVYLSARIDASDGAPMGVVVVKVELDSVEQDWREGGQPVFVTDGRGIVVATSVPQWRFLTVRPIGEAEAADIRRSLQYGEASLEPLGVRADRALPGLVVAEGLGTRATRFAQASAAVPEGLAGWQLTLLVPADGTLATAAAAAQLLAALAMVLIGGSAWLLVRRGRSARRRRLAEEQAASELETRVAARTADLADANRRLTAEMAERERAEERLAALRDDLAQANRLATLGQVTAGVAHEINQPLGAIRTYAENAALFLERGDGGGARRNLDSVVGLTTRIAAITETLRNFSRRGTRPPEPVAVEDVLDGALLILKSRIRESGIAIERRSNSDGAVVMGGRIRLEQVLVNLVRNAIEAVGDRQGGRVELAVAVEGPVVRVTVADNGPGIAPDMLAGLFTPFRTSKAQGTGLGLVISSDIVTEFGGRLSAANRPDGGAEFTVTLPQHGGAG